MKINELFETELNFEITGIVDDSRDVKDGYLFVATKGFNVDHYDYIDMAIRNGAILGHKNATMLVGMFIIPYRLTFGVQFILW